MNYPPDYRPEMDILPPQKQSRRILSAQGIRLAAFKVSGQITAIVFTWVYWTLLVTGFLIGFIVAAELPMNVLLMTGTTISALILIGYPAATCASMALMLLSFILTPFVPKEDRVLLRLGTKTIWGLSLPKPQKKMARFIRKIIEREFHVGVSFLTFLDNGDAILLIDPKNAVLDADALADRLQLDVHVHSTLSGLLFLQLAPYIQIEQTRIALDGISKAESIPNRFVHITMDKLSANG